MNYTQTVSLTVTDMVIFVVLILGSACAICTCLDHNHKALMTVLAPEGSNSD